MEIRPADSAPFNIDKDLVRFWLGCRHGIDADITGAVKLCRPHVS